MSVQSNSLRNLVQESVISCGLGFFPLSIQLVLWGFVSVLGCDPRISGGFQVSGTRKCCFAAQFVSFREVRLSRQSGQDHLAEPY